MARTINFKAGEDSFAILDSKGNVVDRVLESGYTAGTYDHNGEIFDFENNPPMNKVVGDKGTIGLIEKKLGGNWMSTSTVVLQVLGYSEIPNTTLKYDYTGRYMFHKTADTCKKLTIDITTAANEVTLIGGIIIASSRFNNDDAIYDDAVKLKTYIKIEFEDTNMTISYFDIGTTPIATYKVDRLPRIMNTSLPKTTYKFSISDVIATLHRGDSSTFASLQKSSHSGSHNISEDVWNAFTQGGYYIGVSYQTFETLKITDDNNSTEANFPADFTVHDSTKLIKAVYPKC